VPERSGFGDNELVLQRDDPLDWLNISGDDSILDWILKLVRFEWIAHLKEKMSKFRFHTRGKARHKSFRF